MAQTVVSQLHRHAAERPSDAAVVFLEDGEAIESTVSYAQLHRSAARHAHEIRRHCPPGGRALLAYHSGIAFVEAFVACLYAGVIAVPVYPPRPREDGARLAKIARNCGCSVVLSVDSLAVRGRELFGRDADLAPLPWLCLPASGAADREPDGEALVLPRADDVAFLQYTSGSTSDPKGVVVTHGNLAANFHAIQPAMAIDRETVFLSWLPLNHDMGLVGIVLQALYFGNRMVLMSPAHFLQKPMRWPAAIAKYRATLSGGPNFAFDLCARRATPEALASLDLRSWKVAFNGAEPIRAGTFERFAQSFVACGFDPAALFPCYGLAETTLYAAGGSAGVGYTVGTFDRAALADGRALAQAGDGAIRLVASGTAAAAHDIAIVEPDSLMRLPDGRVGEIWLRGPSIAAGYWRLPDGDGRGFGAQLQDGDGPYLRTGDLGFLRDGELFVTGRIKDLIISRGRNVYPQDIELTAEQVHAACIAGGAAAFTATDRPDDLVIVVEVRPGRAADLRDLAARIAQAVMQEHELFPKRVVLIRPGSLPRTSSGKVRRRAADRALASDALSVLADCSGQQLVAARLAVTV